VKAAIIDPAKLVRTALPGGGVALARASPVLSKPKHALELDPRADNDDQRFGNEIVRKAGQQRLRQIAENASEDGAVNSGKVLDKDEYNRAIQQPRSPVRAAP